MADPTSRRIARTFYSVDLSAQQDKYQELAALLQNQQEQLAAEQNGRRKNIGAAYDKEGIGRFVIPAHNTWAAHQELITSQGLQFDADQYPPFDAIITACMRDEAFTNNRHAHYHKYDNLRTNLAVVRNYLYDHYFPDGSFDKDDLAKLPLIREIALDVGVALANGGRGTSPLVKDLDMKVANQEPEGAQEIYRFILSLQRKPGFFNSFLNVFRSWLKKPLRMWDLRDLKYTPFSSEGNDPLHAPPPGSLINFSPTDLKEPMDTLDASQKSALSTALQLSAIADQMANSQKRLSVNTLGQPVLSEAVEIAHEILRKLRINAGNNDNLDEMLRKPPEEFMSNAQELLALTLLFEDYMQSAATLDPGLAKDGEIQQSKLAVGQIAYYLKALAATAAEQSGDAATAAMLAANLAAMPDDWKSGSGLKQAVGMLKKGLEKAAESVIGRFQDQERVEGQDQFSGLALPPIPGSMKGAAKPHETKKSSAQDKTAHQLDSYSDWLRERQQQRKELKDPNAKKSRNINSALKSRMKDDQLKALKNFSVAKIEPGQEAINPSAAMTLKKIQQERGALHPNTNSTGKSSQPLNQDPSYTAFLQQQEQRKKEQNIR